jgi:adenine-specific DNA-methyltransferase
MEKLKMQSHNVIGSNTQKIARLFPNCVTERLGKDGKPELAIDFEKLQAELSNEIIAEGEERYQFTWPDKRASVRLANTPTTMTLRPCREESVDFDNTQNLYIEGDNLDVLKVLRETYLGRVKMIYIDPPYNTGNDFVYNDDFAENAANDADRSFFRDEEGNIIMDEKVYTRNTESNGRFHTDWLNMIYPRLKVARDLLSEDGVIFISIDDNEIENLRKVCDDIYGEQNFVGQFIWRGGRRNLAKYISTSHEYMLLFAKNLSYISEAKISWNEKKKGLDAIYKKADELVREHKNYELASKMLKEWYRLLPEDNESKDNSHYCWIDKKGVYFASDISRGGGGGPRWDIINPNTGNVVQTPSRGWSYGKYEDLIRDIENGLVHFNGDGVPCKKRYLKENETQVLETVFYKDRRGSSKRLRSLMDGDLFPFPKDEEVIEHYVESFTDSDALILDFFSGSATTAHAVMKLNAEDGGNRKFIMVQLPEKTDEKSEAYKAGYKNICEIGKERIRRAGRKINEELGVRNEKLDIGFRVLKLDSSNMEDVYYTPKEFSMNSLFNENVKSDRTNEDLLFQVMLDLGIELSVSIRNEELGIRNDITVFNVDDGYLMAVFDKDVDEKTITEIAKRKPVYFVMRDASASNDNVIDNFEQIFKHYSPETTCRII